MSSRLHSRRHQQASRCLIKFYHVEVCYATIRVYDEGRLPGFLQKINHVE